MLLKGAMVNGQHQAWEAIFKIIDTFCEQRVYLKNMPEVTILEPKERVCSYLRSLVTAINTQFSLNEEKFGLMNGETDEEKMYSLFTTYSAIFSQLQALINLGFLS